MALLPSCHFLHSLFRSSSSLLPLNRRTRPPISASCSRAPRTSILASRVGASIHNRYASCWCTGNSSPSAACPCAGAIAGRRGSPSIVVLRSPAVGCRLGVYQVVTGTGPRRVDSICRLLYSFLFSTRYGSQGIVIYIYHDVDCSTY